MELTEGIKKKLTLDVTIRAFKLYKVIALYYDFKPMNLYQFQKTLAKSTEEDQDDKPNSIFSDKDKIIKAFSYVVDFITDTYDIESKSYSKESLAILSLIEEVTGIDNIKEKSLTEVFSILNTVQDSTTEALQENFTQD